MTACRDITTGVVFPRAAPNQSGPQCRVASERRPSRGAVPGRASLIRSVRYTVTFINCPTPAATEPVV